MLPAELPGEVKSTEIPTGVPNDKFVASTDPGIYPRTVFKLNQPAIWLILFGLQAANQIGGHTNGDT